MKFGGTCKLLTRIHSDHQIGRRANGVSRQRIGVGGFHPYESRPVTGPQARAHFREIPNTFLLCRGEGGSEMRQTTN
jgi:hypothetical protein